MMLKITIFYDNNMLNFYKLIKTKCFFTVIKIFYVK